jgi:hypothetical protein
VARIFVANNQPPVALQKKVKGVILNPTGHEVFNTLYLQE